MASSFRVFDSSSFRCNASIFPSVCFLCSSKKCGNTILRFLFAFRHKLLHWALGRGLWVGHRLRQLTRHKPSREGHCLGSLAKDTGVPNQNCMPEGVDVAPRTPFLEYRVSLFHGRKVLLNCHVNSNQPTSGSNLSPDLYRVCWQRPPQER